MNYTTAMIQLPLVKESEGSRVRSPEDVYKLCSDLSKLAQESFQVLLVNSKNKLMNRHMVTLGLVDASLVHPREVFRPALTEGASAIILTHNHPSGDPTPSVEDIRVTKQMIEAGRTLDIKVLDHIIIGRKEQSEKAFVSMREDGICNFS